MYLAITVSANIIPKYITYLALVLSVTIFNSKKLIFAHSQIFIKSSLGSGFPVQNYNRVKKSMNSVHDIVKQTLDQKKILNRGL